jgi:protein-L-isoaspartate(D-aspartate) O-methyltransferase
MNAGRGSDDDGRDRPRPRFRQDSQAPRRAAPPPGAGSGGGDAPDPGEIAERKMRFLFALRSRGVTDRRVLEAMEQVDRGLFVQGLFSARAYDDTPLPISCGQTISQPSVVGLMTQALEVGPRDKVLEVGTGSGYQAAILGRLARRVYTIDRYKRLTAAAQDVLGRLGLTNVITLVGDGSHGLPEQAPFDRILVTAAAEDPPGPLLAQLREGGIMVVPVGQSDAVQSLIKVRRTPQGYDYEELLPVRFVPLVEGLGRDDEA